MEYFTHRWGHHSEDQLAPDPTGQLQADLFEKHIFHHVYMNSKYRVAYTLYMTLGMLLGYYILFYCLVGTIPTKCILAAVLQGMNLYDWLHYSYHHYDLKFPF